MARPLRINFSVEKFMKRCRAAQNSEKLKDEGKKGLIFGTFLLHILATKTILIKKIKMQAEE
jgi:hypothetical protein